MTAEIAIGMTPAMMAEMSIITRQIFFRGASSQAQVQTRIGNFIPLPSGNRFETAQKAKSAEVK
jgi:hypothetical protein